MALKSVAMDLWEMARLRLVGSLHSFFRFCAQGVVLGHQQPWSDCENERRAWEAEQRKTTSGYS